MKIVLRTIIVLCAINFGVFWFSAVYYGGTPSECITDLQSYCLTSHGKITEVPEKTYDYMKFMTGFVIITHIIGISAALAEWLRMKFAGEPMRL